ncbi:hypothetical protein DFH07DRAFT_731491, partial [Mycena maculata]
LQQFGSPRYSTWYSVGLLARNTQGDVAAASLMLRDVTSTSLDPTRTWVRFLRVQVRVSPNIPAGVPVSILTFFVCTSFIIVMEKFQHLLEPGLMAIMKQSMYNTTVGDGYCISGFNGDVRVCNSC